MLKFLKIFKFIYHTSIVKTLYVNFHYLDFYKAIHLPVLIARHTLLIKKKGTIDILCDEISFGLVKIGYLGLGTQDAKYDRTKLELTGNLLLHGKTSIGRGSNISVGGVLEIGENFCISGSSTIICKKSVVIGKDVLISWDCLIMDTDFHSIFDIDTGTILNIDEPIQIGEHVWIGCRNTILKGSVIPDNCVLAAATIFAGKLTEKNCVYGGSGKRAIKSNISWKL